MTDPGVPDPGVPDPGVTDPGVTDAARPPRPDRRDAEDLLRSLAPQVLGTLVRRFGDFASCEDSLQEALLAAAVHWTADGVPEQGRGAGHGRRPRRRPGPAGDPRRRGLAGHHRLHAVRARLLDMTGDTDAARAEYREAAARTISLPERRHLLARAARLYRGLIPTSRL